MLGGVERNGDADATAELTRPLSAAVDDRFAGDRSFVAGRLPADAADTPVAHVDADDLHAFRDRRAVHARTFCQRLREIGRICLAVARNPDGAGQIVGAQDRRDPGRFGRRDEFEFDAEALCPRHLPFHQRETVFRLGDVQAAALFPAGSKAGFLFERRIEVDSVTAHPRRIPRGARLADQSRSMPCRAAREASLLQQHDVANTEFREMIRGRRACDAAADDDDAGVGWDHGGHLDDGGWNAIRASTRRFRPPRLPRRPVVACQALP